MIESKIFVNQKDNFAGNFGEVFRSSAIFYYKNTSDFKTSISFVNYWKFKRNLDVALLASLRDMSGNLIDRESLNFESGEVINYSPCRSATFEGSVEIEVFSNKNMVIPYSAMMGVYESKKGVSMVHSYARAYCSREIEDGRCITVGEESCWTLRDSKNSRSFGIFHNGPQRVSPQGIFLRIKSKEGQLREARIELSELAPYQTVRIFPADHIRDLKEFLNGSIGNASLSFRLGEGFTRMLVGHESLEQEDFQVTHSNFNFSKHVTDKVENMSRKAFMHVPRLNMTKKKVVVFPDSDPGDYTVVTPTDQYAFVTGQLVEVPIDQGMLTFSREDGIIPSRIVTALTGGKESSLPFECSLGVLTHAQPLKRMWWGLCAYSNSLKSRIIVHDLPDIFGGITNDAQIAIALYSSVGHEVLKKNLSASDLQRFDDGVYLNDFFPDAQTFLAGGLGYFTVTSSYGGLTCYSTLENSSGSFCIEHGF